MTVVRAQHVAAGLITRGRGFKSRPRYCERPRKQRPSSWLAGSEARRSLTHVSRNARWT
jgi:hypothetical protein